MSVCTASPDQNMDAGEGLTRSKYPSPRPIAEQSQNANTCKISTRNNRRFPHPSTHPLHLSTVSGLSRVCITRTPACAELAADNDV